MMSKKWLFFGILPGILLLISGCAAVGPYLVDPRAWESTVASLNAERARYNSRTLDERQYQERAQARQFNSLAEIRSGHPSATYMGYGSPVNSDGYSGGYPVLLINDSRYNCTFYIRDRRNQQWIFKVGPHQEHIYKFEVGPHYVQVFRDDWTKVWRETVMRVWADPVFHHTNGSSYYGFVRVWGRGYSGF